MSEIVLQDALREHSSDASNIDRALSRPTASSCRYGAIHATARLRESLDLRGPRIEMELQSGVFAWALQRAIKTPAVAVRAGASSRSTSVARDPRLAFGRLRCALRSVRFATADGTLFVHVDVAVT